MKDYIDKLEKAERRALVGTVERREIEGDMMPEIYGVACVFEQPTDMGWYIEKVARTAFEGCDMSDVVALFNHDDDEILSRTTGSDTDLMLQVTEQGLIYRFRAKNECAKECADNIQLGFIKGSSFAFTVEGEEWSYEGEKEVRTITKIGKLYDVSPVTWPAYQQTSAAIRSKQPEKRKQLDLIDLKILNKKQI